jgi:hypothetical protein
MGPYHKFFCLKEGDVHYSEYTDYIGRSSNLRINDDLRFYIADSLEWIPTISPAKPETWKNSNLDVYGVTIINKRGGPILCSVIETWIKLFSNSPSQLRLRGPWESLTDDEGVEMEGSYAQLIFNRDEVISMFRELEEYSKRVCDEDFFILHIGI